MSKYDSWIDDQIDGTYPTLVGDGLSINPDPSAGAVTKIHIEWQSLNS